MDTRWGKIGVKPEEFKSYKNAFEALEEFLTKELRKKEAVRDYGPGWELKQVAVNEYNQVLEDIIKIIKD